MTEVTIGRPRPQRKSLLLTRVTPGIALLVIGSIAVLRLWVVEMAVVEGNSMTDTFQTGDRVLVVKLMQLCQFDIVLVKDPELGGTDIKRIVAMPGDVVSMVPFVVKTGAGTSVYGSQLYVNSIPYKEPYAASVVPRSIPPTKVPADSYFVLGDNRDDSIDSRHYGPVKAKSIRGVAVAVVSPPQRMRVLTRAEQPVPDVSARTHL